MQKRLSSGIFKLEQQDWLVIAVLVVSCVLLLVSHFLAVRSISQPRLSPSIVQESFAGNDLLRSLEGHLLEVEGSLKNLILLGEDNYALKVESGLRSVKEDVVSVRTILGRFDDGELLGRFEELVDEKMRYHKNILDAYHDEGVAQAEVLMRNRMGYNLMDSILRISQNLREIHSGQIKGYLGAKTNNNIWLKRFNWFSILSIFIIVPFTIFYLIRAIKKRKLAEESKAQKQFELDQQFSFIKDLYKNAPIGYHSITQDGTVIEMNDTELKWLGYKRDEVVGHKKMSDLLPPDAGEMISEINQKLIKEGGFDSLQLHMLCKNGSLFEVLMSSRSTFDDAGNLLYSRSAVMDYSERKKLEDDLESARHSAEKSAILKEQFVANISHEIRTPLNAILGFSNLLQRTDLHQDQSEFAHNIQISSENLMAIINDILDFSKIEAGMLHLDKVPFSLPALLHSVRSLFQIKAREKDVEFRIHLAQDVPGSLIGDPTRLIQILVNLIGNAFKFTEKGKIEVWVSGSLPEHEMVTISFQVKDTGIGIPPEKIDKIFERFGQATAETTRRFGGTGLGLTITKQLVELQNGSIDVDSEVGKGTTFRIAIPYEIAGTEMPPMSPGLSSADELKDRNVSILIVEDNPMNQRILELILDEWGISHKHVSNGNEAIELLKMEAFDLVFMDIQMPELDGYATTSLVRQKLHLEVPIIATTAHAFPGEREKCISYGMNDYIAKPLQQNELYSLILRYSGRKKTWKTDDSYFQGSSQGFDRQYVMDITQGKEDTIREMANLFIDQSAKELREVEKALGKRDFVRLANAAHSLKSTTAYMGFNDDLGQKVHLLEQIALTSHPNDNDIRELIGKIKNSRESAIQYLKTEYIREI